MRKITIKKIPLEILILIGIIFCIEHFVYLVSESTFKIAGILSIDDFGLILYCLLYLIVFIKYINFNRTKYSFKWIALFPIILAITSSYMGLKVYNQPFMLGFRPQRFFILTYLLYFPLKRMIDCNSDNIGYIKKLIVGFGFLELILYITQYFLINKIVFLNMRISSRFGETRLPFESLLLLILPFVLLNEIFNKKHNKLCYSLLGLNLFYLIFIVKTRMVVLGVSLTIAFLIFIYKKGIKKIGVVLFILVSIFIGLNTSIGQNYINALNSEYREKDPNTQIRLEAQNFYITETAKTPFLGRGVVNTLYYDAVKISRYNRGYYFNDNGIIGFYYLYGLIGVGWSFLILTQLLIGGYKQYKVNKNYFYIGYTLYVFLTCITMFYWYEQEGALYLVGILTFIDARMVNNKKRISRMRKTQYKQLF